MTDVGYIAAGFLLTFTIVAAYLLALRTRIKRARHAYEVLVNGVAR